MNLIQQPFAVDHTDVLATQELLAHPVFGPLLWKILLIKEQEVLDEITAIAETSGKLAGFEIDLAHALCAEMKVECTLVKQDWDVPAGIDYLPDDPLVPLRGGETIGWKLV